MTSNDINKLTLILIVVIVAILVLLGVLFIIYIMSSKKKRRIEEEHTQESKKELPKAKTFAVESVIDFMEFDKIEDNMIVQKDGKKYIMVVECQGINYDLMSEVEKNAVEEGFIQFLNTIRHPVQIYTQTRTINLDKSIQSYREKVKEIEDKFKKEEEKYKEMLASDNYSKEQLDRAYYELTKQKNLSDYGKDIIYNTERMSLNKNVLNKKYYVVIPYYTDDLGQTDFDKEELKNLSFSELYTRSQSILRTLSVCGINGKILTSNELADLLYVAYNRDESETYGLDRALKAGYDELYSTAPDVLDKKIKALDNKIEQEAFKKANQKIYEAKSEKQKRLEKKEENMDDLIDRMAKLLIAQNKKAIGEDIAAIATEKIDEEKKSNKELESKGGTEENGKEKTKRRRTKTA